MKLLLVTSGGGHLAHLMALRPWWSEHERSWVALDGADTRGRLAGERVHWVRGPTNRSARALLRNGVSAPRVLRRERPDRLVSAGAALAVPYFAWARALRIRTTFIEVMDRIERPSLTGRIVGPIATEVLVHWPEQVRHYPGAIVLGPLWGGA